MTQPITISLQWLPHGTGLPVPKVQTALSAGADLCAAVPADQPVTLTPGARAIIPCGFAMALPAGYEAQVRPRSGLAAKHGVTVLNSPGTVDADYRGEVKVILVNLGQDDFTVTRGERVAQMVIAAVVQPAFAEVEELDETIRGSGGFGSTGR